MRFWIWRCPLGPHIMFSCESYWRTHLHFNLCDQFIQIEKTGGIMFVVSQVLHNYDKESNVSRLKSTRASIFFYIHQQIEIKWRASTTEVHFRTIVDDFSDSRTWDEQENSFLFRALKWDCDLRETNSVNQLLNIQFSHVVTKKLRICWRKARESRSRWIVVIDDLSSKSERYVNSCWSIRNDS